MSWKPEVEEIERRRALAREMGGEERVRRQHERGKLTARERVERLLDPGSFEEIGILADHTSQREEMRGISAPADGVVTGAGEINGRPIYLFSEDFTVLGGSTGQTGLVKRVRMRELALQERVPLVYLLDGAGARAQESILGGWAGGGHFLLQSKMSGIVPQVAGILGPLGGDPALEVPLCDFKVMVKGTAMVAAGGPPLVRAAIGHEVNKEELGGYEVHTEISGVVDNAAADDADALEMLRRYLGYMPQSCWELPPREDTAEDPFRSDEALLEIVSRNRSRRIPAGRDAKSITVARRRAGDERIEKLVRRFRHPIDRAKATSFAFDRRVKPESLRTNWSDEARISSSGVRLSRWEWREMIKHFSVPAGRRNSVCCRPPPPNHSGRRCGNS